MAKKIIIAIVAVVASLVILPTAALAGGSETCTTGNCQFQPATWVPGTTVTTTATSHSEASSEFSITKTKRAIKRFERIRHRKIAVRMKAHGIKGSRGCMDPVRRGLIKPGQLFWNTRANGSAFLDHWQKGWKICHYRVIKWHGHRFIKGTKKNCGNRGIKLPFHFKVRVKHKVKKSLEVRSYKEFWFKYVQRGNSHAESESGATGTATTGGHYSCPAGWELVGGNTCKYCPPPSCHTCEEMGTCPPPPVVNKPPKCEEYKSPQHVYPGMGFAVEVVCSDPEDGANVTVRTTVQRGSLTFISHQGTTWRYQYTAPSTTGDETLTFTPEDSQGLSGDTLFIHFPIPVDEK